jgi:hypothetical protein
MALGQLAMAARSAWGAEASKKGVSYGSSKRRSAVSAVGILAALLPVALFAVMAERAWARGEDEPFCEHEILRIIRPQPADEFDHWLPEANPDQGFLSSTAVLCEAEVKEGIDSGAVRWRIRRLGAKADAEAITGQGLTFRFTPAALPGQRRSDPLAYEITAEVRDPASGGTAWDAVTIRQDEIDQIRQEYVDFPRRSLDRAPRQAFVDRDQYEQEFPNALPWSALNKTRSRAGESYRFILLDPAVVEGMRRWQELLGGRELLITSGYRNPYKQAITSRRGGVEAAPAGMHQYGKAVDVQANVTKDFRDWVTVAWTAIDAGADYVETIPEGAWHHVHADWRREGQGPADTVKLAITGQVTDAAGSPLSGATILGVSDATGGFRGMPAWRAPDAEGRFELRTVWHPGRKYVVRVQSGRHVQSFAFTVPEGSGSLVEKELNVSVPGAPVAQRAPRSSGKKAGGVKMSRAVTRAGARMRLQ